MLVKSFNLPSIKKILQAEINKFKYLEKDDLEINNAGQWPKSLQALLLIVLLASLIYASDWLLFSNYKNQINLAQKEQEKLFQEYQYLAIQATNLASYQYESTSMQTTLDKLLNFLPTDSNIPFLLDAIQQEADKSHLEIISLSLNPEKTTNYYIEIPFTLELKGTYHQLASYLANISSFSRIITLHNFILTPDTKNPNQLKLFIEAQTYRSKDS